jgi:nitrogen regulatory protein PII 1
MKMVTAFIRPERVDRVIQALEESGLPALTRLDVYGKGRQNGVKVWGSSYDMPKTMLITVVEDGMLDQAVETIGINARTGNIGDGKIFITPVEGAYTVRTGEVDV